MSDESFTHDEASFEPGERRGGVAIADGEARYADLVSEVIWAGTITPESRQRLETAREMFGLSPERAEHIEEALIASQTVQIHEEPTVDDTPVAEATGDGELPAPPESQVSPIAASDDPRIRALQRRILVVEDENDELAFENRSMRDLVQQLENLVEQLQYALEETLEELHVIKGAEGSQDHATAPTASMVQAVTPPPEPPVSTYDQRPAEAFEDSQPGPESGPTESAEIPLDTVRRAPVPEARPELPTLMGLGEALGGATVEPVPDTGPRPHVPGAAARTAEHHGVVVEDSSPELIPISEGDPVSEPSLPGAPVPSSRRRFRSHEEIEEAIEPIFAAAPPGVTRRKRRNPADLHQAICVTPRDPELLHALLSSLGRADDADRRWCVSQALVYLDAATEGERALYDAYATSGLPRPRRALDDAEWHGLLFHPDEELLTGRILAAIAPAVLLGQMTSIRASISPELLAPEQQIDPNASTLQAVRCLVWAAAILGLPTPPIFVVPEHEGGIDVVLNPRPTTRLGKRALSGRRSRELAFEAGRHLSWYRKEHLLGRPSRSVRRLEDSFLAALMIGNPGLPITTKVKARVEPIARTIRPLLDDEAVAELERGFSRFVEEGGRTRLGRWLAGAEKTALRAGMLLSNDLWAAERMLALDDPGAVHGAIDDLVVFITSEAYGKLRRRLGIAIPAAEPPAS